MTDRYDPDTALTRYLGNAETAVRSPATLGILGAVGAALIGISMVPAASRTIGIGPSEAIPITAAILGSITVATIGFRTLGPASRVYRFLEQAETVVIQAALVSGAYVSHGGAGLFWILWLAHVAMLGALPLNPRLGIVVTVVGPTLAAVAFWRGGDATNALVALATMLLGLFLSTTGRRATTDVVTATAERERLADELSRVQVEAERRRIARDLHDGLAADLHGLSARLDMLQSDRGEEDPGSDLGALRLRSEQGIDELRSIVWALRAEHLPFDTMVAYVRDRCAELCGRRVALVVSAPESGDSVPGDLRLAVVRSAQEAVRNAVRHGAPENVRVTLDLTDGLRLSVEDDGKTLTDAALAGLAESGSQGGLQNLASRARERGGKLALDRSPLGGLRVAVTFPRAP